MASTTSTTVTTHLSRHPVLIAVGVAGVVQVVFPGAISKLSPLQLRSAFQDILPFDSPLLFPIPEKVRMRASEFYPSTVWGSSLRGLALVDVLPKWFKSESSEGEDGPKGMGWGLGLVGGFGASLCVPGFVNVGLKRGTGDAEGGPEVPASEDGVPGEQKEEVDRRRRGSLDGGVNLSEAV